MVNLMYLERNEKTYGPFSSLQLKKLAAAGRLLRTDLLRKDGMEKGVPAANIKALFPDAQARDRVVNGSSSVTNAVSHAPAASASLPLAPESTPSPAPVPGQVVSYDPGADTIPDDLKLAQLDGQPEWKPEVAPVPPSVPAPANVIPSENKPSPPKPHVRKLRATILSGAILGGQDGTFVRFRKKCTKCTYEDSTTSRTAILLGIKRETFFCPKCKKIREVQIQGVV